HVVALDRRTVLPGVAGAARCPAVAHNATERRGTHDVRRVPRRGDLPHDVLLALSPVATIVRRLLLPAHRSPRARAAGSRHHSRLLRVRSPRAPTVARLLPRRALAVYRAAHEETVASSAAGTRHYRFCCDGGDPARLAGHESRVGG